ncbi:unnamed protein product [Hymenolepis diminuta]|uniref:Uncharacterized protein n=1 Tax=Hymenolepis diminuta TaxID=6216 RepID=A0A3P7BAH8_HYMDI|nr:unnamed protein product [Hymenolepis diminuta]
MACPAISSPLLSSPLLYSPLLSWALLTSRVLLVWAHIRGGVESPIEVLDC